MLVSSALLRCSLLHARLSVNAGPEKTCDAVEEGPAGVSVTETASDSCPCPAAFLPRSWTCQVGAVNASGRV